MEEPNSFQGHLLKIKDIGDQLKLIERNMEEEDTVVMNLESFPP